jgi:ribosomal protein S18 acetylase RimI-like enzyme
MLSELNNLRPEVTARPAQLDDAEAVCALCNAWSMRMEGMATHDPTETRIDWQMPGFNVETDTVVVHADRALIAHATVWDTDEPHVRVGTFLRVHPDHEDPALEEALLRWLEARAGKAIDLAPPDARVTMSNWAFSKDERRKDLLARHGYELVRHFVRLRIEMDGPPEPAQVPEGIEIRPFDPETDLRATAAAVRDAFRDHWGHVENDFEEELAQWTHWVNEDPDFDPGVWLIAWDGGEIVGACCGSAKRPEAENLGYIQTMAVREPWRGRGIARGLLRQAFAAYYERGKTMVDLDADAANLTGAMRLYEGVGMSVVWQNDTYEKELRPGVDLQNRG